MLVSVGETSTVVFHRLRFYPKALSVLAYLLLISPPFHYLLPIVSFFLFFVFFTQRTNSAGIPRFDVEAGKPDDKKGTNR